MESRPFQEPTPRNKKAGARRTSQPRRAFKGRALGPGELHLFRELLHEFAGELTVQMKDSEATSEYTLQAKLPNLVDYIEYRLERLRREQETLDKAWEPEGR